MLLRREDWEVGKNLRYRIYCEEALQLRSKLPGSRKVVVTGRGRYMPSRANIAWSMDVAADQLANGLRIRASTVKDVFTREALSDELGYPCRRIKSSTSATGSPPSAVPRCAYSWTTAANSPVGCWICGPASPHVDFSRPTRPIDNCFIESFNGLSRDESLKTRWFESMEEAKHAVEGLSPTALRFRSTDVQAGNLTRLGERIAAETPERVDADVQQL